MLKELREFFENDNGVIEINEEEIAANVDLLFKEMDVQELAERMMEDFWTCI